MQAPHNCLQQATLTRKSQPVHVFITFLDKIVLPHWQVERLD